MQVRLSWNRTPEILCHIYLFTFMQYLLTKYFHKEYCSTTKSRLSVRTVLAETFTPWQKVTTYNASFNNDIINIFYGKKITVVFVSIVCLVINSTMSTDLHVHVQCKPAIIIIITKGVISTVPGSVWFGSVRNRSDFDASGSHIYKTYRVSCIMHIQYSASARSGPCAMCAWLRSAHAAASSSAACLGRLA